MVKYVVTLSGREFMIFEPILNRHGGKIILMTPPDSEQQSGMDITYDIEFTIDDPMELFLIGRELERNLNDEE